MPLLGKFSRGSSTNTQTPVAQPHNGYQSTSRGPKPPPTGPAFISSPFGSSQATPSAQGATNPLNISYPRKSSRSPSFFPIFRMSPQTQPSHRMPPQPSAKTLQTQAVPIVNQPPKSSPSNNVPVLETRATEVPRPPGTSSSWRSLFSRSASRDKPPISGTGPATRPSTPSRAPSPESLVTGPNMTRPVNRVFEGVHETKALAVHPVYSGSKSSLTSGSVPSLVAESTPKSTMRSQTRVEALMTAAPVSNHSVPPINPSSQALAPPVKDPPAPPPAPPPSAASSAFPNTRLAIVSATSHQRKEYTPPRSASPIHQKSGLRNTAPSSPHYVAAQPQSVTQVVVSPALQQRQVPRTADSGNRDRRTSIAEHGRRKPDTSSSSLHQQAVVSTRGLVDSAAWVQNMAVAENSLAIVARSPAAGANKPPGSTPPNRISSNPPSDSRALTKPQAPAHHRYDSTKSRLQVVTSHTFEVDDDDPDDLLTPSSLASGHGWEPASSVQHPPRMSKTTPKLLEAAPPPAESMAAVVPNPGTVSSSLVVFAGQRRLRTDSVASGTSSSASSEVVITSPLALAPRNGSATVVPSPASSAFPPMITCEDGAAVPQSTSLELAPRSTARPLHRHTSTPDPQENKTRDEMVALLHPERFSTAQNGTASSEQLPRGTLAIEPPPAAMNDAAASGQVIPAKVSRPTAILNQQVSATSGGKPQALVDRLENNSNNQLSPRLVKNTSTPTDRVSDSRAVIVGAAKPSTRGEERTMEIIRFAETVRRQPSRDMTLVPYPPAKGSLDLQSPNSGVLRGAQEQFNPSRSHQRPPLREIEAPAQDSGGAHLVATRASKVVAVVDSPQKKKLALASASRVSLDETVQVNDSRALVSGGTRSAAYPMEGVNEGSGTMQAVARRPSREVTIGSRAQARMSSDALLTEPSQRIGETRSLAVVAKGTSNVEVTVKETPPKPPVVQRPPQDASTVSSPARGVGESVKAVASEERQIAGNRPLAQRVPRRLSITVPKPPLLNAVLSPVSSEASQPIANSTRRIQPPAPVASPPPPQPVPPKVIEPAPKVAAMESAIVPLPTTPSMLPAPPPTPQAELGLVRARAATNSKATAKGENRKRIPALTTGSSDNESTPERALLQPPPHAVSRARSPSPLAQELPPPVVEEKRVVVAGSISRSGLQIDALASALSPADATTPVGPMAIVRPSNHPREDRKFSGDETHQAVKPPNLSHRNKSNHEASASRNPRRRIESTPSKSSNTADSGQSPGPLETRTKNGPARSNTLDDITARLVKPASNVKPPLAIPQSLSTGEEKQTAQTPPTPNKRPSGLSSTRPPEQRRLEGEAATHSASDQESNWKTRAPSPTNDPPAGVRRGHSSPVPIPPPPEFHPPQDSSPPRGMSENPNSPPFSTSPSPQSGGAGSRQKPRGSTLPTPPSSNGSTPPPTQARPQEPLQAPPAPFINTSSLASTGRVWRSRRSGAPSALNALSPSVSTAAPVPIPRGAPPNPAGHPSTPRSASPPRPGSRSRELSLPSSSSPSWSFFPSYTSLSEREARLEKIQREFEEEKGKDIIPAVTTKPPQPFIALNIPLAKKSSPFAFLSRSRHVRTLSSASLEAAGGSQTMGSVADAASRRSGFSDFTPPPSPGPLENVIHQWHDALDGKKKRKPGVTWDVDTGSPVASFPQLMSLDGHTDLGENT